MAGRERFTRRGRLGLVFGVLFAAVAFATVAFADTVTGDADVVTVGTQTSVNLGTVAPGESLTRSVGFTLVCAQKKHVDLSESVTIEFRAVGSGSTAPSGGSLTATNTSIGPVPASWPDDEANCPSPTPQLTTSPSSVTLTAPSTGGTYSYTVQYRIGISGPAATAGDNSSDVTGSGSESVTYTLTVPAKQNQTITFPAIADKVFGGSDFAAGASASSGLPVAYEAVGDCSVGVGTVHILAAGSCTVTASQGGDGSYNAAAPISHSFSIAKANQTITFQEPASPQAFGSVFAVSASSDSGLGVAIAATGVCSYNGMTGTVTITSGTGDCVLAASQSGNQNFNAASDVVRTVTASRAVQEIAFSAPAATYGDADSSLDALASSGLTVTFDTSTPATCTIVDGKLHVVAAGPCTVTASQAGNADYAPAADVSHTLMIAKGSAVLSLGDLTKTYNGSPQSATVTTTPADLTGVSVTYDGSSTAPTNAGSYAVVASLDNPNYEASSVTGTLVIGKASATLNLGELSKTYNGSQQGTTVTTTPADLTAVSVTYDGSATAPTNAGSYAVVASLDNPNYEASSATGTLLIARRPITGSITVANKVYDGNGSASITGRDLEGTIPGDDVQLNGGSASFDNKNVGQNIPVTVTGATLAGTDKDNYDLGTVSANSADITAKPITGSVTVANKVYDGSDSASITGRSLAAADIVSGDVVSLAGGSATFTDKNVANAKIVSASGFTLAGTDGGNYYLAPATLTTTADITPRPVEVTADAKSKVYGDDDPALTYSVSNGSLVAGDGFSGNLTRDAGENVGGYDVEQGTLTAGTNYELSYVGAQFTITQRPIEVTADARSKVYGDDDPALTYGVSSGSLVVGDGFSGSLVRDAGENVGGYDIEQGTLTAGTNYELSYVGAQLTITQRPIGVTADPHQKILNAPDPALSYSVTSGSLAAGDGFSGALTRQAGEAVGTYAILQGTLTAGPNYALSYAGATLKILYAWNGYLQPINDTAHQTGVAQSKFRLGQTVPAKFVIKDANGVVVQQAGSPAFSRSGNLGSCDAQTEPETITEAISADAGVLYRWDGSQYHYNWSTKGLTAGEYRIYANLADGTKRYVDICLTR